ncbi:Protein-glutamate methylesterase/protein-glutamine glutaminase [Candidatus Magnetaquicoccaceae bacterium FCR-1]|uniref:Protein-glutamate methylesterase/protein-glutamine glutaminase n=1 Tax=Candidatus Magnetaquiglobus chichijimensis TaxID=3141448 RepID=A0ABQ0C5D4_9PROT
MAEPIKAMVVDDTITYRMIMKNVAESIPGIRVTATSSNGKLALDKIVAQFTANDPERPDLVLLDVEMPVMDGLTTLKELRKRYPKLTVVMVSSTSRQNANIIVECLNAGALDFITKPLENNVEKAKTTLRQSLEPILTVLQQNLENDKGGSGGSGSAPSSPPPVSHAPQAFAMPAPGARMPMPSTPPRTSPMPPPPGRMAPLPSAPIVAPTRSAISMKGPPHPDLLLIGSSTGGPAALTTIFSMLREKLPIPTLIVQHMPPVFTTSLAAQLSRASGLMVKEARDEQPLTPGSVTIAMGGRHMTLQNRDGSLKLILNDGPKVNECRPAVDVLFMSVAASFTGNILSVILTGMGRDGTNGVDALKRGGKTWCITQDKNSCVVYGMPRSVEEKGLSDESLSLETIGPRIIQLCNPSVAR